jgi:hypothetical protein
MSRITKAQLDAAVAGLNRTLELPQETYEAQRDANGNLVSTGNYQLDSGYGGYKLTRNAGSVDVSREGYVSIRELYVWIWAFREGIDVALKYAGVR